MRNQHSWLAETYSGFSPPKHICKSPTKLWGLPLQPVASGSQELLLSLQHYYNSKYHSAYRQLESDWLSKKSYNNLSSSHLLHVVCSCELNIFKCFSPKGISQLQQHYIQHLPYYFIFTLTSNLLGRKTDTALHRLWSPFSSREDSTSGSITENMISLQNTAIIKNSLTDY